jgi:predicted transcriptional regulator of viral defense system
MKGVGLNNAGYRTQIAQPPVDALIAEIARRQHGVIAREQLRALGLSPNAIHRRVAAGRLIPVHRGVYAVGHALLGDKGRWMAAVVACGPAAVLSHRSAAALWELRPSSRARIDVSSPGRRGRTLGGIEAHRGDTLRLADIAAVDEIPCTSIARTLLDLADVTTRRDLERACDQAEIRRLFDLRALDDVLARAAGRHGAPLLQAILADLRFGASITRSELEERFLQICTAAGLPTPQVNAWLQLPDGNGLRPDFLWADHRLIAETDSRMFHDSHRRFEHDRRRDQVLTIARWRVIRFTWRQVFHEPAQVATTLRALLDDHCAQRAG